MKIDFLNEDNIIAESDENIKIESKIKSIDYSKYLINNWRKKDDISATNKIYNKGGAIWMTKEGDVAYRFDKRDRTIIAPHTKAKRVISNFLDEDIKIFDGSKKYPADIEAMDLLLVKDETFEPHINSEFYKKGNSYYLNKFKPTKYMQLKAKNYEEPKAILSLIKHLVNGNEDYYKWFVNWLAYFFQGINKSQVSLILRGNQGAGKGILWDLVITPLFGFIVQINDKALKSNFLKKMIENKLFYNLDEISHDIASSKSVKNYLKALVTNKSVMMESKNIDMEEETPLNGQVLITSNEPYVAEIEVSDRRFTVFSTGDILTKVNFLGYRNYDNFKSEINKELENFAIYLKSYDVDIELANKALDTPEKRALVNATNDKFTLFVNAIKNLDIKYFSDLEEEHINLYRTLENDFNIGRICKENIKIIFNILYEETLSSKKIIDRLKTIDPILFGDENITKNNSKRYYKLKDIKIPF